MRNLKKIVAVIMTVALLASMMVPALAAVQNEDKAQALQAIGLFKGNGSSFDLDLKLIREQGMAIVVRALGAEKDALALSEAEIEAQLAKVADADTIATWARPYAAYMVKNDLTKGIGGAPAGQINYGAQLDLYADEFVILLLRAMGYPNVEKNNVWDLAVEAKLLTAGQAVSLKFNGTIIRDDVVGVLYNAVKSGVCADGTSLIGKLIASGAVDQATAAAAGFAEPPAPKALEAEVKLINLKQLQVVFNKQVDKDTAENVANYEVKDKGETKLNISSASISADLKTVTLTLGNDPDYYLTNNSTAKVTIKEGFKDADGNKLSDDKTYEVVVGDTTFPTFDSVEAKGLKLIRLYFSEPLKNTSNTSNYTVKSGSYTWSVVNAKQDVAGHYVDLTLGTNLIEGPVSVKVSNNLKDYADLMVFEKTIDFTFEKITTAPTATITKANPDEVVVKFDRPVYGNLSVWHGGKYDAYQSKVDLTESQAKDEVTFTFTNKVPAGSITIIVGAQKDKDVKDLYGNKYVEQTFTVTIVNDTTPPVVKETKVEKDKYFQITFDEPIDASHVDDLRNYSLKKVEDGSTVYFSLSLSDSDKVLTVTPASEFADNTEYEFTIKKLADKKGNEIKSDLVLPFKTGDNKPPKIEKDSFVVEADGKIYIYFSEPMNHAEMAKKSNYMVATNSAADYRALGDKDTVSVLGDKLVLIDLNEPVAAGARVLVSVNVTDLAGNKLTDRDLAKAFGPIGVEVFKMEKAEAIAKNKIKITFNREVGQFTSNNLTVEAIGATQIAISAVESLNGKEVVIALDTDLSTDAKLDNYGIRVMAAATTAGIKTVYGTQLLPTDSISVDDKIAPEVVKVDDKLQIFAILDPARATTDSRVTVSKGSILTISIEMSEKIEGDTLSNKTFTVDGYKVLGVDLSTDGKTISITAEAKEDKTTYTPAVTLEFDFEDINENVFAAKQTWSTRHLLVP